MLKKGEWDRQHENLARVESVKYQHQQTLTSHDSILSYTPEGCLMGNP